VKQLSVKQVNCFTVVESVGGNGALKKQTHIVVIAYKKSNIRL